jgi:hypothetical protein
MHNSCTIAAQSLRHHYAILRSRCAIAAPSLHNRCAITAKLQLNANAAKSLYNHWAIAVKSLRGRCVITAESLRNRCTVTTESMRNHEQIRVEQANQDKTKKRRCLTNLRGDVGGREAHVVLQVDVPHVRGLGEEGEQAGRVVVEAEVEDAKRAVCAWKFVG